MNKFVLIIFGVALICGSTAIDYAKDFQVEVSVKKDSFNRGAFKALTKIKNVGTEDKKIEVWTCSYGWSWIADQSEIMTGVEGACMHNFPFEKILKPNEEYRREMDVIVSSEAKKGPLTFRLGFYPRSTDLQVGIFPNPVHPNSKSRDRKGISSKGLVWSNPLSIDVKQDLFLHKGQ